MASWERKSCNKTVKRKKSYFYFDSLGFCSMKVETWELITMKGNQQFSERTLFIHCREKYIVGSSHGDCYFLLLCSVLPVIQTFTFSLNSFFYFKFDVPCFECFQLYLELRNIEKRIILFVRNYLVLNINLVPNFFLLTDLPNLT